MVFSTEDLPAKTFLEHIKPTIGSNVQFDFEGGNLQSKKQSRRRGTDQRKISEDEVPSVTPRSSTNQISFTSLVDSTFPKSRSKTVSKSTKKQSRRNSSTSRQGGGGRRRRPELDYPPFEVSAYSDEERPRKKRRRPSRHQGIGYEDSSPHRRPQGGNRRRPQETEDYEESSEENHQYRPNRRPTRRRPQGFRDFESEESNESEPFFENDGGDTHSPYRRRPRPSHQSDELPFSGFDEHTHKDNSLDYSGFFPHKDLPIRPLKQIPEDFIPDGIDLGPEGPPRRRPNRGHSYTKSDAFFKPRPTHQAFSTEDYDSSEASGPGDAFDHGRPTMDFEHRPNRRPNKKRRPNQRPQNTFAPFGDSHEKFEDTFGPPGAGFGGGVLQAQGDFFSNGKFSVENGMFWKLDRIRIG